MTGQAALPLDAPTQPFRPGKTKASCRRDPNEGPGSCWWWWEGCPNAERRGCYRLWAAKHLWTASQ